MPGLAVMFRWTCRHVGKIEGKADAGSCCRCRGWSSDGDSITRRSKEAGHEGVALGGATPCSGDWITG
jgi:hypothetical protein